MAEEQNRIREILAGLAQPEEQPGLVQRILMGIPQALSVLASEKPGDALGEQLKQQVQAKAIEKQRRDRLKELGATLEIEDIIRRAKESREEAADERRMRREADIRKDEFKATTKEQRLQIALTNRFQISRDRFKANEDRLRDIRQNRASKDLVEFQAKVAKDNAFYGEVVKNSMDAIMSGHMDAKTAVDLAVRAASGEGITEADVKAINKAISAQKSEEQKRKLELVGAEARARSTGKTPMEAAQEFSFEFSRRQAMMWILDVDGKEKQVPLNIEPLTQQPIVATGQKFLRNATQLEVQQKALSDFMQMQGFSNIPMVNDQSNETQKKAHAEAVIRSAITTRPFEDVKKDALSEPTLKGLGLTQPQMNEVLVKIQGEGGQEISGTLDETEAELKEISEELKMFGPTFIGRGVDVPRRSLSDEEKERRLKLNERQAQLLDKRNKQAAIKAIEDQLTLGEAQLSNAKTEMRRERITQEIKNLKARLKELKEGGTKAKAKPKPFSYIER